MKKPIRTVNPLQEGARLHNSALFAKAIVASSPGWAIAFDDQDEIINCNPATVQQLGEKILLDHREIFPLDHYEKLGACYADQKRKELVWEREGNIYEISYVYNKEFDVVIAFGQKITSYVRDRAVADYLANHDTLTKLANRHKLESHIEGIRPQAGIGVMILDLDMFKHLNDEYGHTAGDNVIKEVARRLKQLNTRIKPFVARLGGDEFVGIVEFDQQATEEQMKMEMGLIAQRILTMMRQPFEIKVKGKKDKLHQTSASIGINVGKRSRKNLEALLDPADKALYAVKARGRDSYVFYVLGMQEPSRHR